MLFTYEQAAMIILIETDRNDVRHWALLLGVFVEAYFYI
jgi:hypothetical protein